MFDTYLASYLWKNSRTTNPIIIPTSYIALGASPPTSGAVRIDAASYSGIALSHGSGGTLLGQIVTNGSAWTELRGDTSRGIGLGANNQTKWTVLADAGGTSTLSSASATARIIGGSSNGLAIRNSGNTQDNFVVSDTGSGFFTQSCAVGAGNVFQWNGRSAMSSAADGNIRVTNNAGTDFGLLQFGGTTSSFPALKRASAALVVRLADDSADGSLYAGNYVARTAAFNAGAGTVTIGGTTATTVGAAGGASALPATPLGYIICNVGGTTVKVPYYNN